VPRSSSFLRATLGSVCSLSLLAAFALLAHCGGAAVSGAGAADGSVTAEAAPPIDVATPPLDAGTTSDATQACGFSCEGGAADAPTFSPCPPGAPPPAGTPCSAPGEKCEYGTSWWLDCNVVAECLDGVWKPAPSGPSCPFGDAGDAGGSCPATWNEASALDASAGCPASDCQYPQGACVCITGCMMGGKSPIKNGPIANGVWTCAPSTADCPTPRPALGTACHSSASCQYGSSCGCGELVSCMEGVWQGEMTPPCP
jgi:hypothetical protein